MPPVRGGRGADARPSQVEIRVVPWTTNLEPQNHVNVAAAIERLDGQLQALSSGLSLANQSDAERAERLHQLADQLTERRHEILTLVARIERVRYARVVARLHGLIARHAPRHAVVAVISRGDQALISIPGRRGWHFPQAANGVYAGHHPADSEAAIAQLERVRARGARYLAIPRTAFWWLDHYHSFDAYLRRAATCLARDEHTGALFALPARRVHR
jgi:hypothetical protein